MGIKELIQETRVSILPNDSLTHKKQQEIPLSFRTHPEMIKHLYYFGIRANEGDIISWNTICTAYRKQALQTHPDRGGSLQAWQELRRHFEAMEDMVIKKTNYSPITAEDVAMAEAVAERFEATLEKAKLFAAQAMASAEKAEASAAKAEAAAAKAEASAAKAEAAMKEANALFEAINKRANDEFIELLNDLEKYKGFKFTGRHRINSNFSLEKTLPLLLPDAPYHKRAYSPLFYPLSTTEHNLIQRAQALTNESRLIVYSGKTTKSQDETNKTSSITR